MGARLPTRWSMSASICRPEIAAPRRSGSRRSSAAGVAALAMLWLLSACAPSETLFQSNFDQTQVNQPPDANQAVGTARVDGPPGSVIVIAPPVTPSGKWVQISRPNGPQVAGLQGNFSQVRGDGVYTFSATMFMPAGSGVATIQFERQNSTDLSSFLHLDFMPDNSVRIDDNDAAKFGSFPRDKPFIVQVTLDINASGSTARMVLSGAEASGERNYTILSPLQSLSRQFGAIRIWQGFPHIGAFDATNIAVSRKT